MEWRLPNSALALANIRGTHMPYVDRFIMILVVVVLAASPASAAGTAEDLLRRCEASIGDNYCAGYIAGFYDGRTTSDYGKPELRACLPTDASGAQLSVTYTQMVRVFVKWAKDHPDKLHWHDWQAVRQAFADAWPCPTSRSR